MFQWSPCGSATSTIEIQISSGVVPDRCSERGCRGRIRLDNSVEIARAALGEAGARLGIQEEGAGRGRPARSGSRRYFGALGGRLTLTRLG